MDSEGLFNPAGGPGDGGGGPRPLDGADRSQPLGPLALTWAESAPYTAANVSARAPCPSGTFATQAQGDSEGGRQGQWQRT